MHKWKRERDGDILNVFLTSVCMCVGLYTKFEEHSTIAKNIDYVTVTIRISYHYIVPILYFFCVSFDFVLISIYYVIFFAEITKKNEPTTTITSNSLPAYFILNGG